MHLRAPSDPEVGVTLTVEFPATYPKSLPLLRIEGLESLRQSTKDELRGFISTKPKSLLGEEMIFELATTIQDILEDAAQARAHAAGTAMSSLEEERNVREAAANQVAKKHLEEELRKKEAETAEEERVLEQLVDQEVKRRQERARLARRKSSTLGNEQTGERDIDYPSDIVAFDQPIWLKDDRGRSVAFRTVYGKTQISKASGHDTYVVKPVVSDDAFDAPLLILREVVLEPTTLSEVAFRQRLRQSEDKLEALKKLRHPNIVDFLGFKISRSLDDHGTSATWSVTTLLEYANKGSLSEFLDIVDTAGVTNVRGWMIQLLEALDYFHRHGIVHEDIQCRNVMLFRPSSGKTFVKLSGGFQNNLPGDAQGLRVASSVSPSWHAPELAHDVAQTTVKTDVWDLGVVFLQMAFGKDILKKYTSPIALIAAHDVSDSLEVMTRQLFRTDPKKRPTPFDLLPSEFLRDDSPLAGNISTVNSQISAKPSRARHDSSNMLKPLSRYANDFVAW